MKEDVEREEVVDEEEVREDATRRVDMRFRAGLFVHTRHERFTTLDGDLLHFDLGFVFMRCSPFFNPLRAQSITAFAGRHYATTTIGAGPSNAPPPRPQAPETKAKSQDELRRKRRTEWKRRQNVSGMSLGLAYKRMHCEYCL